MSAQEIPLTPEQRETLTLKKVDSLPELHPDHAAGCQCSCWVRGADYGLKIGLADGRAQVERKRDVRLYDSRETPPDDRGAVRMLWGLVAVGVAWLLWLVNSTR